MVAKTITIETTRLGRDQHGPQWLPQAGWLLAAGCRQVAAAPVGPRPQLRANTTPGLCFPKVPARRPMHHCCTPPLRARLSGGQLLLSYLLRK